jgi:phage terminase large subunit
MNDTSEKSSGALRINGTEVLRKNLRALTDGYRIIVHQGGSRSSKTFSLCQTFIGLAFKEKCIMSCVRGTMPALRGSAMRDFQGLLEQYELYHPSMHDKTNSIYRLGQAEVEFFGLDEAQKVRGRKRKYLWCNEANELGYEDFLQLALRTTGTIFLDYNPSDTDHWIYDKVLTRSDATLIISTYLDNPFLDDVTVSEIERLEKEDANHWRIYGLGQRGIRQTAIYSRFDYVDAFPDAVDEQVWGLDFGYNNPTALVRIGLREGEVYVDEYIYQSGLTNSELINKMIDLGVPKGEEMYGDSEAPDRIEEIARAGFLIYPAEKGQGSVKKGIDILQSKKIHFTKRSTNLIRDWKSYSWKMDKNGVIQDEPVKFNDHGCDAIRYPIYTKSVMPTFGVLFSA